MNFLGRSDKKEREEGIAAKGAGEGNKKENRLACRKKTNWRQPARAGEARCSW